jgi:AcrR family transcriptional regulator
MNQKDDLSTNRRRQIHQAALTCFVRKGYHMATMDDIVAESGLSKGTLYWYFPSKKELFVSLLDDTMVHFGEEWQASIAASDMGAIEKLKTSLTSFKNEMSSMAPMVNILLEAWALLRHDEEVEQRLREFYLPYVEMMTAIIQDGIDEGVFFVKSPQDSAIVIVTLFDGILLAISTGLDLGDWNKTLDTAEVMVLRALGVRSESLD